MEEIIQQLAASGPVGVSAKGYNKKQTVYFSV